MDFSAQTQEPDRPQQVAGLVTIFEIVFEVDGLIERSKVMGRYDLKWCLCL